MNTQRTLFAGAIFGALGVMLGAFGAHAFKPFLVETGRLETFELAVRYEFYHALALLAAGLFQPSVSNKFIRLSSLFFVIGILLFSGSLYLLCFTQIKLFGAVTPFGGVFLILGWILFAVGVSRTKLPAG
jgi:uncharacterized membrane protein YgdD (TMEM256/DUF423 family)